MTLGRAFLVWIVGFLVLTLVVVSALQVRTVQQTLDRELRSHAEVMARSLAGSMAVGEVPASLPVLAMRDLRAVEVRDGLGRLLWAVGPALHEVRALDATVLEIVASVPVSPAADVDIGGGVVEVELLVSRSRLRRQVVRSALQLLGGLGIALAAAMVIGLVLVGRVVRPLHELAEQVRSFDPGHPLELPVPTGTTSEVRELTRTFSEMAARLARQRQELEASEQRFRELFAESPAPLLELDTELRVLGANPAAAAFLTAVAENAEGLSVADLLPAGEAARLRAVLASGGSAETTTSLETRWRLADGEEAEVEIHLHPVAGSDTASAFLMAIHDVTDRVRRMGERWRRTFDAMVDGVALVDENGQVQLSNLALQPHLPELVPEVQRHAATGGHWQISVGDRLLQCALSVTAPLQQRILVVRDVTEAVRAEARLREVQKMEAVATLASGVAHDFNNLLAGIQLNLRWLQRSPAEVQEAAAAISALADEGVDVVRELLLFARRESTPLRLLDLAALAREQETVLGHLLPEEVQLLVEGDSGAVPVVGNPVALRRVILNLVLNARNAIAEKSPGDSPRGLIRVTVQRRSDEALLQVADDGSGIAQEVREHLFEPFFSLRREGRGAGLGLAVVYTIVNEHAGEIDVQSVPAEGTTITVRLPLGHPGDAEGDELAPLTAADGGLWVGRRLLLVEDEGKVAARLIEELVAVGLDVRHAQSVDEVAEISAGWPPHLVVVDVAQPAAEAARLAAGLHIPLVIVTERAAWKPGEASPRPGGMPVITTESRSPQHILYAARQALDRRRS